MASKFRARDADGNAIRAGDWLEGAFGLGRVEKVGRGGVVFLRGLPWRSRNRPEVDPIRPELWRRCPAPAADLAAGARHGDVHEFELAADPLSELDRAVEATCRRAR